MNRFRALLMGLAASVGAGGIAAYNGVFSTPVPPTQIAAVPGSTDAAKTEPAAAADGAKAAAATDVAKADPNASSPAAATPSAQPAAPADATAQAAVVAPSFDVLRVEPDGSVLIAGKATEAAQVEVLSGADVLGVAKAAANGDFAITLSTPLKPGDYQLVLRATGADGKAATSIETATVAIPDKASGQVLALVEEPGKPSRIITTPEKPVETAQAQTPAADPAKSAETNVAPATPAVEPAPAPVQPAANGVVIEAVETEAGKMFIAGTAQGVVTVRISANDTILGDVKPGEGNRFLGEFQKELPAGDYIIKAEGIAADGVTVVTRSTVPYKSEAAADAAAKPAAGAQAANTANADAPAEPAKPKAVIIRRGDTLWQISRRVYGRGVRYSTIYLANQDVTQNPNRIFPGQVFKVPEKTPEGDAADPAEIEKRAVPADSSTPQ